MEKKNTCQLNKEGEILDSRETAENAEGAVNRRFTPAERTDQPTSHGQDSRQMA